MLLPITSLAVSSGLSLTQTAGHLGRGVQSAVQGPFFLRGRAIDLKDVAAGLRSQ